MVTEIQSESSFFPQYPISDKEFHKFKEMMNAFDRKEVNRIDKFIHVLRSLKQEYLDQFYGLIGKANLEKYLRYHRRRINKMRRMRRENDCSLEGLKNLEAQRQKNIDASSRLVLRSGIDPLDFESLQLKYLNKFRAACRKIRPREDKEEKRPSGRSPRDANLVRLRSPFDYALSSKRGDRSGGDVQLWGQVYADRYGDVSGESLLHVPDGDDWHDGFMFTNARVGSFFHLPCDGDIIVRARYETYQDLNSYFYGYTRNDCAWVRECDIVADVTIRLLFFNLTQGRAACKWRRLYRDGTTKNRLHVVDRDTDWDYNWWENGDVLCTCIGNSGVRFTGPNYENDLVYLEAGLYTENVFSSEDFHVKTGLRHVYDLIEISADCGVN